MSADRDGSGSERKPPGMPGVEPASIDLCTSDLDWLLGPPPTAGEQSILGQELIPGMPSEAELLPPALPRELAPTNERAPAQPASSATQGSLVSLGATAAPLARPAAGCPSPSARKLQWLAAVALVAGVALVASFALRARGGARPEPASFGVPSGEVSAAASPSASGAGPDVPTAPLALASATAEPSAAVADAASAPPMTRAEREALEARFFGLVDAARWPAAAERLLELVGRAPDFLERKRSRSAALQLLTSLAHVDPQASERALRALAGAASPAGGEIVLHVALYRGGEPAQAQARAVLTDPDVGARAAPDLRVALELYRLDCGAGPELCQRAADEGGPDTLLVLLSLGDRCGRSASREQAIGQLKRRLHRRQQPAPLTPPRADPPSAGNTGTL